MICASCRAEAPASSTICATCGTPFPIVTSNMRAGDDLTMLPSASREARTVTGPLADAGDDGVTGIRSAAFDAAAVGTASLGATGTAGTGFDANGFGATGFGATGFDATGFDATGFDPAGAAPTGTGNRPARRADQEDTGPLSPGQAFGPRYHIIKLLGLGGMGAVYQAWDSELGVIVALKVIRPEAAANDSTAARDMERRFKRELLLARQVTHRNVVRIHDLGELNGIKYITMPFLDGCDLATILDREGRLDVPRTLRIARGVLAGLVAAHQAGVVHRDLKPANIMIGEDDQALIMDFGIARSTGDASMANASAAFPQAAAEGLTAGHTSAGEVVGTIEYMAPEQARGEPADQRADIYAFGLILYDMLLGRRRHSRAESAIAELRGRLAASPPPARSVDAQIPERIDRMIARCIAPSPADRYQTTQELLADLDTLDAEGRPLPTGRRLIHGVITGSILLVVAMFGLTWWLARPPKAPPAHAPVPVLIADFENRANDPVFQGALEPALSVAIEGASFITSYNRADARKIAGTLKAGSRLDAGTARLVALREGIKVVLAGDVSREAGSYAVTLRALNAADGKQIWGARTVVPGKDKVLTAVGTLAADVRQALGDTASAALRMAPAETFTTSSLESVRDYAQAQDLLSAGRFEDAIALYRSAVGRDPKFGRAYSGWATAAFYLGRKDEAAAQWKKALALTGGMTDREKYRTLGTYYFGIAHNYEKAIETFQTLVRLYPTDLVGLNNLAFAYFGILDFKNAQQVGERAHQLYPKNTVIANNYALYAMYAGSFEAAATQAAALVQEQPSFFKNYLPLAVAALADGKADAARNAYERMATTGRVGESVAAIGRADLEMYLGRFADAGKALEAAIKADERANQMEAAGVKYVALAEVYENTGRVPAAIAAARQALKVGHEAATLVPAARLFARLKLPAEARAIARQLDGQLEPQSRAWGKIIEGDVAGEAGQYADAIDAYRAALKLADFWLARFGMGVAYVKAGHEAEGLPELEACNRRRGEATALFLDDTPTFRVLATLPYWVARAQEGVGQQAAAANNYRAFLAIRGTLTKDPLVKDAHKRVAN